MSNALIKASQFKLKSLVLSNDAGKSIDIKFLTNDFSLNENMSDGFLSGKINVFDGLALYTDFPLRGQEYIEMELSDFDSNVFRHKFFVFAIDDLKPVRNNNDHMMQYTMHFASIHKVYNESAFIRNAYRNQNMHEYATEVFDGAFVTDAQETKTLETDIADNKINVIAPGYNPIQTMHFFARKSYSNRFKSGTFRFFETKKNFQFRNHEAIAEDYRSGKRTARIFGVSMLADSSPSGTLELRKNLIDFNFGTHVNTIRDLGRGLYNRTIMEIDPDNKTIITSNYKHHDNFDDYIQPDNMKDIHDTKINDLAYHPHILMVDKNWATPYDPQHPYNIGVTMTPDILARKQVVFELFHESAISVSIHGDLSIHAGDMIQIKLPKYIAKTDNREVENPYNGFYLIDKIIHKFKNDEYYAELTIGRLGIQNYGDNT